MLVIAIDYNNVSALSILLAHPIASKEIVFDVSVLLGFIQNHSNDVKVMTALCHGLRMHCANRKREKILTWIDEPSSLYSVIDALSVSLYQSMERLKEGQTSDEEEDDKSEEVIQMREYSQQISLTIHSLLGSQSLSKRTLLSRNSKHRSSSDSRQIQLSTIIEHSSLTIPRIPIARELREMIKIENGRILTANDLNGTGKSIHSLLEEMRELKKQYQKKTKPIGNRSFLSFLRR